MSFGLRLRPLYLLYYKKMESLRRQLMRLTIPIFMEIALVALVGFVDMFMLSSCGDGAVAAVGLATQIVMLVFLVYRFAASGVAIVCAQYHGAGLRKRLVQVVGVALIFNAVLGFVVSAFLYFNAEAILRMMGLREELMSEGAAYLRIAGAFSFSQALGFTFSASLRSVDRVKSPMVATAVANIVNVVGNYLLIYGHCGCPALGVVGAAWATAASQVVSMAILLVHHTRVHIRRYPFVWFKVFPWREFTGIFKIGLPAIGEEMSYCLSQAVTIYFINQISTEALTTRTYVANSVMFTYLFGVSVVQAGDILVGHLVGGAWASDPEQRDHPSRNDSFLDRLCPRNRACAYRLRLLDASCGWRCPLPHGRRDYLSVGDCRRVVLGGRNPNGFGACRSMGRVRP